MNDITDITEIDDPASAEPVSDDVPLTRRCGRCLIHFPVDADTDPMELRDWWACPNCAAKLLPGRHRAADPS